jgi:hypothetical protein
MGSRGEAPGRGSGAKPPEADGIFYDQSLLRASEFAYLTALVRVVIICLTNVSVKLSPFDDQLRLPMHHQIVNGQLL